jgi:hypothetical protein
MPLMLTPNIDKRTPRGGATEGGPERTAAQRQVRMFERIFPHRSPDPPRQGDTPARPARWPTWVSQSRAAIHAVMEDEFRFELWAPDLQIQQLHGQQAPLTERANIAKPSSVAYGSLFTLVPPQSYVYE